MKGEEEMVKRKQSLDLAETRFQNLYFPIMDDWRKSSSRVYTASVENRDAVVGGVTSSSSCLNPLYTSSSVIQDARHVVEELTVKNMHDVSCFSGPNRFGQGLELQDNSQVTTGVVDLLPSNEESPKHLQMGAVSNFTCRGIPLIDDDTGKRKTADWESESNWEHEKVNCEAELASNSLLEAVLGNGLFSSTETDCPGYELPHSGVSLREWLEPGKRRVNKAKSLQLFREIVELVDFAHSQGVLLLELKPSCLVLLPSNKLKYVGSSAMREATYLEGEEGLKRRASLQHMDCNFGMYGMKKRKFGTEVKLADQSLSSSIHGVIDRAPLSNSSIAGFSYPICTSMKSQSNNQCRMSSSATYKQSISSIIQLEDKWYTNPEEIMDVRRRSPSNIYELGVLLFELLCCFESREAQSAAMSDLALRILPPNFLSEYPREAGFCLWLIHPDESCRPTTREILQSDLLCGSSEVHSIKNVSTCADEYDFGAELLDHFLVTLKTQKEERATKLVEDIGRIEEDIKDVQRRFNQTSCFLTPETKDLWFDSPEYMEKLIRPLSMPKDVALIKNISQLEEAYFFEKSHLFKDTSTAINNDKDLLRSRKRWTEVQHQGHKPSMEQQAPDRLGTFFEGLCRFARYHKFEVRGTLRSGDLLNSGNVIRSIGFNRDENYFATAGVSKKIKIFEFSALLDESVDIHYPVVEMANTSKLSCVCWNSYMRNYLASTDYDGAVQIWDTGTAQVLSRFVEHQKRAWSVDFSQMDPTKFASGSDDFTVRMWGINEKGSVATISSPANVCGVQFSPHSTHLLAFGCADNRIYCFDLRHVRVPWCTLAGHGKTVSYVKFLDSETIVSASTDNSLKLWDLKKTNSVGLSAGACTLTFRGHTNEKNFVGLSILDGYITCGSETNEVYSYYKSFPMPLTSHAFGSSDPYSGLETGPGDGTFVSSVCWGQKEKMIIAANSAGSLKILEMV